jgi:hypothetical protein
MRHSNIVRTGLILLVATIAALLPVGSGQAREPFLTYSIGGFAPKQDLQISAQGRCTLRYFDPPNGMRVRHSVMRPRRLAALKATLVAARWGSLHARYAAPGSPGSESVFYSVTFAGRTITTNSEAREQKRVPPRLLRLLNMLDRILATQF